MWSFRKYQLTWILYECFSRITSLISHFCLCSCYYRYCFYFIRGKPESPTVSVLESGHLARTLMQTAFRVCWRSFLHSLLSLCETLCSRIVRNPSRCPFGEDCWCLWVEKEPSMQDTSSCNYKERATFWIPGFGACLPYLVIIHWLFFFDKMGIEAALIRGRMLIKWKTGILLSTVQKLEFELLLFSHCHECVDIFSRLHLPLRPTSTMLDHSLCLLGILV